MFDKKKSVIVLAISFHEPNCSKTHVTLYMFLRPYRRVLILPIVKVFDHFLLQTHCCVYCVHVNFISQIKNPASLDNDDFIDKMMCFVGYAVTSARQAKSS